MTTTVTICDEALPRLGIADQSFVIVLPEDTITVRELIRQRVLQEVKNINEKRPPVVNPLIQPVGAEKALNKLGYEMRLPRAIDGEARVQKAIEAFRSNGFLLLINDEQVDDIDGLVYLQPETKVTFLKLVPLVGG